MWYDEKKRLAALGYLDRLFLSTADEHICSELGRIDKGEVKYPYAYEVLLFPTLLNEASILVDRVLAYRREARDLEILAVKAAMDYALFNKTAAIDIQLEKQRVQYDLKGIAKITQDTAAAAFGNESPESSGFEALSAGRSRELVRDLVDSKCAIELIDQRWTALHLYQDVYWAKHNQPGNALNFAERASRVYELLSEDITEAYVKAAAVAEGILIVFRYKLSNIPNLDPLTFLDNFVNWIRETIRFVEYKSQFEVLYTIIIPLTQPWLPSREPIVSPAALRAALTMADSGKSVSIAFRLPEECFSGRRVRLKGVGLSIGTKINTLIASGADRSAVRDSYTRMRAVIRMPEQARSSNLKYRRPDVVLGNITVYSGSAVTQMESGVNIQNVDPIGDWAIDVDRLLTYKDGSILTFASAAGEGLDLVDFKLNLRVSLYQE